VNGCDHYDCTGLTGWSWFKGSNGQVDFHGTTYTGGQHQGCNETYLKPGEMVPANAEVGDIVVWSNDDTWENVYHAALYSGKNNIIEAYSKGLPSREININQKSHPLLFCKPKACK
jgi:cell wall-associated NlpC family hydrolase